MTDDNEQGHVNVDYGEGHDLPTEVAAPVVLTVDERRAKERTEVMANCVRCAQAQAAGYATCPAHRPQEFLAAVVQHAYVTQAGAGHDVEMQTARNALRTWRPQHVHYHTERQKCNERCHMVFPNDLPYWGGSNVE